LPKEKRSLFSNPYYTPRLLPMSYLPLLLLSGSGLASRDWIWRTKQQEKSKTEALPVQFDFMGSNLFRHRPDYLWHSHIKANGTAAG
jgi:hypothetical protein